MRDKLTGFHGNNHTVAKPLVEINQKMPSYPLLQKDTKAMF